MNGLVVHAGGTKLKGRQELLDIPTPDATASHSPIPHHRFVEMVIESLAYRKIDVIKDEYAIAKDGARVFGFLTLDLAKDGVNLMLGIRNSHDRSFAASMVSGFKVFVCDNLAFVGEFEPLKLKHSAKFLSKIEEAISLGVDRTQRKFDTIHREIDVWKNHNLPDHAARALIYEAFIDGKLDAPMRLAESVHQHYFNPPHPEFAPRNYWSLHNAFTEGFKELVPESFIKANLSLSEWFPQPSSIKTIDAMDATIVDQPDEDNDHDR